MLVEPYVRIFSFVFLFLLFFWNQKNTFYMQNFQLKNGWLIQYLGLWNFIRVTELTGTWCLLYAWLINFCNYRLYCLCRLDSCRDSRTIFKGIGNYKTDSEYSLNPLHTWSTKLNSPCALSDPSAKNAMVFINYFGWNMLCSLGTCWDLTFSLFSEIRVMLWLL